jgi:phosphonopyruvate decarboxylase
MIKAKNLIKILEKNKINFFTGVPDSILRSLSSYLEKYSIKKHVIASNEGAAISIGIGYNLSTKKVPCIYLQNSGLSNAINPLISIASKDVYSIPLFLIIGWRGSPKKPDEPQHKAKGKITLNLLKLLKIDYCILRKENDLKKLKKLIIKSKKNKSITACLVEKDTLEPLKKREKNVNRYILRSYFIKNFLNLIPKKCKIISTTGYTSRELMELRKNFNLNKGKDFYMVGGMGHSSSVGVGYALNSKKKVFCLDGDGSILMHLGALRTVGYLKNNNFKHIILNNNSHESVGGQLTNAAGIDFKKFSNSIGYRNYYKIDSPKIIKKIIKKFINSKGPSLLEVKIKNGSLKNLSRPKNLIKIKEKFMIN